MPCWGSRVDMRVHMGGANTYYHHCLCWVCCRASVSNYASPGNNLLASRGTKFLVGVTMYCFPACACGWSACACCLTSSLLYCLSFRRAAALTCPVYTVSRFTSKRMHVGVSRWRLTSGVDAIVIRQVATCQGGCHLQWGYSSRCCTGLGMRLGCSWLVMYR